MNWKDFFYFTQRERTGLLILIVFIVGIFAGKWLFTPEQAELAENVVAEEGGDTPKRSLPADNNSRGVDYVLHSSTATRPAAPMQETKTYYQQAQPDNRKPHTPYPKTEKYAAGTVIDLNMADTTELKKIPGIGSAYAKRITGYRNLLGGYYRVEQLQEVYGMYVELYEKIVPYFRLDTASLRRIAVNSATLDQLKAHPYIDFYQAKAIVEIRKKQGRIDSFEELSLLEEFSEEDQHRIAPYLNFE